MIALYAPGYYSPPIRDFVSFNERSVMKVNSHIIYEAGSLSDPDTGLTKLFSLVRTGKKAITELSAP